MNNHLFLLLHVLGICSRIQGLEYQAFLGMVFLRWVMFFVSSVSSLAEDLVTELGQVCTYF